MSRIVTISNGVITAEISTLGAELKKITKNGKDVLWSGDEKYWGGVAPILFPLCSSLKDTKYVYGGKTYEGVMHHGFAKYSEFEVVSEEKTSVAFLLEPNDETKKIYPFDFKFRVLFKINGENLGVYYIVENHSSSAMPFNVGCHEAYAISGDFNEHFIKFESEEDTVTCTTIKNSLLGKETYVLPLEENGLRLNYDYFDKDAKILNGSMFASGSIIVENIKSKRVTLNKNGEELVSVYFNDFDHLVLWTVRDAGYIAIEPWNGLPDLYDADGIIEHKKSIDFVEAGQSKTFYHNIIL